MNPLRRISLLMLVGITLNGCGDKNISPKSALANGQTDSLHEQQQPSSMSMPSDAKNDHQSELSSKMSETKPETTSMWVTLAGMRCH